MKKLLLVLALVVAIAMTTGKLRNPFSASSAHAPLAQGDVVLYATSWCGYCKLTRELLQREGVQFVEHDIESSEYGKKMHKALNGRGVPLLEVGDKIIRGYDEAAILKAVRGT